MIANGFLTDHVKVTVDDAVASGGSEVDSTALDMTGYDSVVWIVKIGTANAGNFAKAQEDVSSGMGTVQDLLYTKAAGQKVLVIDLRFPGKQFVRAAVIRAGVNTTVDAIVAMQYSAINLPIVQAAVVALAQASGSPEGAVA